jgi:hypothetical protein
MTIDADFPEELGVLIRDSLPNLDAAETLLLLFRHPERPWTAADLVASLRPTVVTEAAARKYLETFAERGLVARRQEDAWQYEAASPELHNLVHALDQAHKRRPVTLVRLIYDLKIRSFADAFKLRKD